MAESTRERPEFIDNLIDTIKLNGNLLTWIAVALIVITGFTVVNNPSQWWLSAIPVLVFGAIIFLFMNARVFLKIGIVAILLVLLAAEAFRFGSLADPYSAGGLLWMSTILFVFFALTAYSYLTVSGASRWGTLGTSLVFGYITTFILIIAGFPIQAAVIIGAVINIALFVFLYKFTRKTTYAKKIMPVNTFSAELEESLLAGAKEAGWNITSLRKDEGTGGLLVWDEKAYYLYPIDMTAAFGNIGKKNVQLGYSGKSVNSWLLNIAFKDVPLWKSRGANINIVLLDVKNRNGTKPKIIGASLPDSKKKLPVGIVPARVAFSNSSEKTGNLLNRIDSEMSPFTTTLNSKQKKALGRINRIEEQDEIVSAEKENEPNE